MDRKHVVPASVHEIRCELCLEHKTINHFSMQYGRYSNNQCNTCRIGRRSFPLRPPQKWRERAACLIDNQPRLNGQRLSQPDLDVMFFPSGKGEIGLRIWRKLCDVCPVMQQCADWGKETDSSGVWGGQFIPYPASQPSRKCHE